ncbi:MAG TPA: SelB C-terminal domain-containing protein [Thermoanaerobaculia bacterium]|nr:SelB C-terminal domain-containing protein [Thermoanaerobaculia bacterium]
MSAPAAGTATAADDAPRRRVVVGTAGHVDHGKTALIERLTGIDCDRWAEEKRRGITIDLGFAWMRRGDLQIGVVDVPGHERFLHNALAGLGGIRLVLLVVAADEGVKPQTREHLAICRLLGIPRALVALTKADLVADDLLELAGLEVEELLAGTPYEGSPRFAVSSLTGRGVAELEAALVAAAEEAAAAPAPGLDGSGSNAPSDAATDPSPPEQRPARLPVDRAFLLKGLGAVVTGTLVSGTVRPGDTLERLPGGGTARVRAIQVHGQGRDLAAAGERTSLQVAGIDLADLERGADLVAPGHFTETRRLLVELDLLPDAPAPLAGWTPVRVHLLAAELLGRARVLAADALAPGGHGVVEIRLASPAVAVRGDRVILRRPSPPATLGGGVVLDPAWRRPRARELAAALDMLGAGLDGALLHWVRDAGEAGVEDAELARRAGLPVAEVVPRVAALAADQKVLEVPAGPGHARRWIVPAAFRRVSERAARALADHFQRDRLSRGMPKAEAVRRLLPGRSAELADVYLSWLAAQGVLADEGERLTLPGREAKLSGEESKLARAIVERYEAAGLAPPSPGEVASTLGAKPQVLEGMVRFLVERGRLVRLPGGLILSAAARDALRRDLEATGWERFGVPQFKDRFGLSRKWAIPLLEHLDSIGATRRAGDERLVVRKAAARS